MKKSTATFVILTVLAAIAGLLYFVWQNQPGPNVPPSEGVNSLPSPFTQSTDNGVYTGQGTGQILGSNSKLANEFAGALSGGQFDFITSEMGAISDLINSEGEGWNGGLPPGQVV